MWAKKIIYSFWANYCSDYTPTRWLGCLNCISFIHKKVCLPGLSPPTDLNNPVDKAERSVLVYLETGNDIITSSSTTSHHHFWSGQGCDGLGPVWPAGTGQPTGGHHQQHSSSTDFTGVNYFHTGRCFILMCQAQNHLGAILHFKRSETLHLTQWQYFDEVIPLSPL